MGDDGHHLVLDPFQLLQLGDVLEHGQGTAEGHVRCLQAVAAHLQVTPEATVVAHLDIHAGRRRVRAGGCSVRVGLRLVVAKRGAEGVARGQGRLGFAGEPLPEPDKGGIGEDRSAARPLPENEGRQLLFEQVVEEMVLQAEGVDGRLQPVEVALDAGQGHAPVAGRGTDERLRDAGAHLLQAGVQFPGEPPHLAEDTAGGPEQLPEEVRQVGEEQHRQHRQEVEEAMRAEQHQRGREQHGNQAEVEGQVEPFSGHRPDEQREHADHADEQDRRQRQRADERPFERVTDDGRLDFHSRGGVQSGVRGDVRVAEADRAGADEHQPVAEECRRMAAGEHIGVGEKEEGLLGTVKVDDQRPGRGRLRGQTGGLEQGPGEGGHPVQGIRAEAADDAVARQQGFHVPGPGLAGEGGGGRQQLAVVGAGHGQHHRRAGGHGPAELVVAGRRFGEEEVEAHRPRFAQPVEQLGVQCAGKGPGAVVLQARLIDADEDEPLHRLARPAQLEQQVQAVVGKDSAQATILE